MPALSAVDLASTTPEQLAELMAGPAEQFAPWILAAAEHGFVEAQAILGQMLLDGAGVPRDAAAGLAWFKRAAHADHLMSINMVGRCYENGWGTEPDQVVAAYWFRLAAERGLDWGIYNHAHMLRDGRGGVPQDRAAALGWYRRAADLGHVKSIGVVGRFLEQGDVVPRDLDAAMDCYRRAAEGGDFRGMFHYGRMLVEQGLVDDGLPWLRRVPDTATPAFLREAAAMLRAGPAPDLAALYEGQPERRDPPTKPA
jgi:TPR repeat protein